MTPRTLTGTVVTARGEQPHTTVTITGDTITGLAPADPATPDTGLRLIPGFIDLHNHGGLRGSFPDGDAEQCRTAVRHHRAHGTTTLLASLVSASEEHLLRQIPVLAGLAEEGEIAGIHLEGPFVNVGKCGAQDPAAIIPGDAALFARLIAAGRGHVRSITFAPETAEVNALLDLCAEHDIIASLGHTEASAEQTREVVDAGVEKHVTVTATHLFNAMPPLHHRAPGAVAALLSAAARGEAFVELIADGVHLADDTVDMVLDSVGAGAFFITDAMQAAGMADGDYTLGTLDVTVAAGVARLATTDGTPG
ncbi:N-acetylglucosamine-6-phosphate deacetylase, partial [Corynebacterium nasicanis]